MKALPTSIEGVVIIEPDVYGDERGFFMETWNEERYRAVGLDYTFKQDNLSRSAKGVLRGLHLQTERPQGKLLSCIEGEIFDVCVDLRVGSPTFGKSASVLLSAGNRRQFYVPAGLAHGFQVISEYAMVSYKATDIYHPASELALLWNDPALGIDWPLADPILSEKDRQGTPLADLDRDRLIRYRG